MASPKQCPITSGVPTVMTKESFISACERCREQDKHQFSYARGYKNPWCDTCQGNKLPKELRIVSLKKLRAIRIIEMMKRNRPETAPTVLAINLNQMNEGRV